MRRVIQRAQGMPGCTGTCSAGWSSVLGVAWCVLVPGRPSCRAIDNLRDVQLQVPLARIHPRSSASSPSSARSAGQAAALLEQMPPSRWTQAVLAAEDDRFYEHPGRRLAGASRARPLCTCIRTGEKGPGGSTITMQVARNFFLGREKTYVRKLNEILLALKIEKELSRRTTSSSSTSTRSSSAIAPTGSGRPPRSTTATTLDELDGRAQLRDDRGAAEGAVPVQPHRQSGSRHQPAATTSSTACTSSASSTDAEHEEAIGRPGYRDACTGSATEVEAPYVAEMVRAFMNEPGWAMRRLHRGLLRYTPRSIQPPPGGSQNQALRKPISSPTTNVTAFADPSSRSTSPITEEAAICDRALRGHPGIRRR